MTATPGEERGLARSKPLSPLPRAGSALETIIVEGPGGEPLLAERLIRDGVPVGALYEARLADGPRFYRLVAREGASPRIEDVTAETAAALGRRRAALRSDAVRDAATRAARLKKLADDHYERTRHSYVFEGRELGFVKPTAETQARLKPDPLARLLANGGLTAEQVRAGLEIRQIYLAISGGLFAKAALAERTGKSRSEVSERIAHLHAGRYLPWAHYLGGHTPEGRPASAGTCPVAVEVTIDVVIEGKSLAEVERERRWRHAMASEILRYALAVYARLAGWEREGALIAAFEAKWRRRRSA